MYISHVHRLHKNLHNPRDSPHKNIMEGVNNPMDVSASYPTIYYGGEEDAEFTTKNWLSLVFMIMFIFGIFVCIVRRISTSNEASCHNNRMHDQ